MYMAMNKTTIPFIRILLLATLISGCSQPTAELLNEETMTEIPVEYIKLTPTDFRIRIAEAPIAYLPLGTLEWHGEHLPLGSDGIAVFLFYEGPCS